MSKESLESNADARTTARRRLVRGVFAAPAALTLYSGGAIAAASNQRCVANQVNDPHYPEPGAADTWVRVAEYKSNGALVVKTAEIQLLVRGSAAILTSLTESDWWTVDNPSEAHTPPGNSTPNLTGRYVAIRVNSDGVIVGISTGTETSGSAIAQTCWSSFVGPAL